MFRLEVLTTDENKFRMFMLSIESIIMTVVFIKHVNNRIIVAYMVSRMNRMVEFIVDTA